jgi:tetratricopeptide (TPR) repeat protein
VAKYLGLMVWPARLSADYSYPQIPLADGRLSDWLAWLVVAIVAAGIVLSYRRSKVAFFAAGFSLITFLPASNLLIPMGTIMAERLLYLPAIGFSICLTLALYSLSQRLHQPAIAAVLLCLIAVGLGARTHVRNADWKDDLTFWSVAVQTAPRSFKSHTVLAEVLDLDHSDPEREMQEDERGLALLDSIPDSLNLARTYFRVAVHCVGIGDRLVQRAPDGKLIIPPESVSKYERAKSLLLHSLAILQANRKAEAGKPPSGIWGMRGNPGLITTDADVQNWLLLSKTDQRLGQNDEALQATREAQELGPLHPEVYLRMHEILLETGRKDEALTALLEGALLTSDGPLLQKLVAAYSDNPDETKCAISYEKVVPQIDFSCTLVRKRVCSISGDLIRIRLKTAGAEAAMRFKKELAAKYGCP